MEFVYVVKRRELFELSFPHGFVARAADDRVVTWEQRATQRGFFVERRHAERDSSFKQIIPYTLMTHGDEIFLLKRLAQGGESRLHGKLSIGVGGHVNPVDEDGQAGSGAEILAACCLRELAEELVLPEGGVDLTTVGVINDESNDVGSVHFGLVHVAACATRDVTVRETDVLEGSFVSRGALRELAANEGERFETWSRLIIERLDEALA